MKKIVIIVIAGLLLAGGWYIWTRYNWVYNENLNIGGEPYNLYVHPGITRDSLLWQLDTAGIVQDTEALAWVADKMQFNDTNVRAGHYLIKSGMTNYAFLTMVRSGTQSPVRVTINRNDSVHELMGFVATKLLPDSAELLYFLTDTFLTSSAYKADDLLTLFIPNTYEFYWTCDPSCFVKRMEKEHERFWNEQRTQQRRALELTESEVYILASIVEKETTLEEEKPIIAGVYLNRIERNMLLQADPTVIFATGDPTIRRVLHRHLAIDSPFNTYLYPGVPPGPICMPDITTIDAVLNPEPHRYLYFCADPGTPGKHAFAETLAGHQRNARHYQNWINQNGIR